MLKKEDKIMVKLKILVSLTAVFVPLISFACEFDTDCYPGSRCIKPSGSIYGVCVGGMFPGNSFDQKPVYSPTDPNGTFGNTCSFDTDCGPGSRCVKSSGSIYGTCLR